ncbi:hypothetical protein [Microscilla marina]|nr:hypothetical protein [Microscilla marina]
MNHGLLKNDRNPYIMGWLKSVLILLCTIQITSTAYAQSRNRAQIKARAWQLLKKYDPNGYAIVKAYYDTPASFRIGKTSVSLGSNIDFVAFMNGATDADIAKDLNTVVHEICHLYTQRLAYQTLRKTPHLYNRNKHYSLFFIHTQQSILVTQTQTFPSKEIAQIVPKDLQTFRFATYISPSQKSQGTQLEGVYGLLDELNAYYQGAKNSMNLYNYYIKETKQTPADWFNFFAELDATYYAYLEFKFYILKYMIWAKKRHQLVYMGILGNRSFKKAYNAIDKGFGELIEQYFALRKKILNQLKEKGHKVRETERYTFIDNRGRGNFRKPYQLLKTELAKPAYQQVMRLLK